jgi:hypothetical protein
MPDKRTKFHEFALKSILFKGREDWYFCFLKAERIAHVLSVLERGAPPGPNHVAEIATRAAALPGDIAHLAAGEIEAPVVLADIFALLSAVRLAGTGELLHKGTAAILETEYEAVAERLVAGSHPSPFASAGDFEIPQLTLDAGAGLLSDTRMSHNVFERPLTKDANKGQYQEPSKRHTERAERILDYLRKQKSASIKDIATTIKGCSEKTIQRELISLIQAGLVKRVGERRWSQYVPV